MPLNAMYAAWLQFSMNVDNWERFFKKLLEAIRRTDELIIVTIYFHLNVNLVMLTRGISSLSTLS